MPILYNYSPDDNLVIFQHVGDVPDDEFLSSYEEFFKNPCLSENIDILVDLEKTSSSQRSSGALRLLAKFLHAKFVDSAVRRKVAVVAPKHLSFGLARMYEAFSDLVPWEFIVFRDREAAQAWLAVPQNLKR